jgi:hypothetical protein
LTEIHRPHEIENQISLKRKTSTLTNNRGNFVFFSIIRCKTIIP